MPAFARNHIALVLLAIYSLGLVFVVFYPSADVAIDSVDRMHAALRNMGAPAWVNPFVVEFGGNLVLFVPLSLLGSVIVPRWGLLAWLAVGLSASLLIEVAQLLLLRLRSPAWYDVVANTLGALMGALCARGLTRLQPRR